MTGGFFACWLKIQRTRDDLNLYVSLFDINNTKEWVTGEHIKHIPLSRNFTRDDALDAVTNCLVDLCNTGVFDMFAGYINVSKTHSVPLTFEHPHGKPNVYPDSILSAIDVVMSLSGGVYVEAEMQFNIQIHETQLQSLDFAIPLANDEENNEEQADDESNDEPQDESQDESEDSTQDESQDDSANDDESDNDESDNNESDDKNKSSQSGNNEQDSDDDDADDDAGNGFEDDLDNADNPETSVAYFQTDTQVSIADEHVSYTSYVVVDRKPDIYDLLGD